MTGPAAPAQRTCQVQGCANSAAALCGRCLRPYCERHGVVRGNRYRGLYDTCNRCRVYPVWKYLTYVLAVVLLCSGGLALGQRLLGGSNIILVAAITCTLTVLVVWRRIPE